MGKLEYTKDRSYSLILDSRLHGNDMEMGIECNYSYSDLFYAAHGRKPNASEKFRLANMTQKERNEFVVTLAKLAKWQTQDKLGTDNQIYTAFAPKF